MNLYRDEPNHRVATIDQMTSQRTRGDNERQAPNHSIRKVSFEVIG